MLLTARYDHSSLKLALTLFNFKITLAILLYIVISNCCFHCETFYFYHSVPGPPKDLKVTTTSVRSVRLTWSPPDQPNGKITYYKIYYVKNNEDLDKEDTYNIHHVDGTRTSHEFDNLTENRTYYFWVCAKTSKGEGNCTAKTMTSTSKGNFFYYANH